MLKEELFARIWERFGTLIILLSLILIVSLLSPYFFTVDNLMQVVVQSSIFMLIGMAELFAILTAGIDLSVGSIIALTGAVMAKMMAAGWGILPSVLVGGIGLGALLGSINGTLIAVTELPPFIITLGGLTVYRGITLVITEGRPIYNYPYEFNIIFAGQWKGIPSPILVVVIAGVITHVFLKYTKTGRNIYAIGGNVKAAWLSGVRVKTHLIVAYTMSGLLSGVAALIMVARVAAAEPLAGTGYELFAIASTVIGGTSFFGGIGNVPGTIIGALVIGVINNALNILNVQTYYQQIVSGLVIIGTVYANKILIRRGEK